MYKLLTDEGQCFLTVEGIPLAEGTVLLHMVRYGDLPHDFNYQVIFDCIKEDGFTHALVTVPLGTEVQGWKKVGDAQELCVWEVEL